MIGQGQFLALALAACMTAAQAASPLDGYPSKPVRIVVPFTAGGGSSNAARFVADKLAQQWKQPVIIENRPGGNTVIGTNMVAKAAPDGYTFLITNTGFTINPAIVAELPYDSARDLRPVATVLVNRFILLAHPSVKANTVKELADEIRAQPDKWNLPTVGAAGIGRIAAESFTHMIGARLQNIPYKGSGELATNLISGEIKFALEIPGVYLPHIKSGRLKALAITGGSRIEPLPQVPTFAEAGMGEYDAQSWYGIFAPGGTPDAIVDKVSKDIGEVVASPEFKAYVESIEAEPMRMSAAEFARLIETETRKYGALVKAVGLAGAQ